MLYWNANFQIPNSGVQAANVYATVKDNVVNFYADIDQTILLFSKEYNFTGIANPYEYLLTLDEYSNYSKVM